MKVLIVTRNAGREGGVEQYIADVTKLLKACDISVSILHAEGPADARLFDQAFSYKPAWTSGHKASAETLNGLKDVVDRIRPDVVYVHDLDNGRVISFLASQYPCVKYIHGYKTTCPDGKRLLSNPIATCRYPVSPLCMLRAHKRFCMPRSPVRAWKSFRRARTDLDSLSEMKAVAVASGFMKDILVRNGIPEKQIYITPYFPQWENREWIPPVDFKKILFVGRLVAAKGILGLVDMMSGLDASITLDIVGQGPDEEAMKKKVYDLGLQQRVKFRGWLEGQALQEMYNSHSVVVVPSIWPEPFGIIGLEAGIMNRPAIAFDVGGISDWLVNNESGFLIEANRFDKMAEKIQLLVNSPEKIKEMGMKANEVVTKNFSADSHIDKLMELFRNILKTA